MYWEKWTESRPDIVVKGKMEIEVGVDFYEGYIDIVSFSDAGMTSGWLINNKEVQMLIMGLLDKQGMEFKRDVQNYLDAEMMFEEYREEKERGGNDV